MIGDELGARVPHQPPQDQGNDDNIVERPEYRDEFRDEIDRGGDPRDRNDQEELIETTDTRIVDQSAEQRKEVRYEQRQFFRVRALRARGALPVPRALKRTR